MINKFKFLILLPIIFAMPTFADERIVERTFIPLESFGLTKKSYKNNVEEYISDEDDEYVAWRCIALMTAIRHEEIEPKTKKEIATKKFFEESVMIGLEYAYSVFNYTYKYTDKDYVNQNPFNDKAQKVLKPLFQKYINLIFSNYEKTGNYFDSDFLLGDIDTCGSGFIGYEQVKKENSR